MKWLNEKLKQEIKNIFEPKYQRKLTDSEIKEIALNLTSYMEHYSSFVSKIKNEHAGI